MQISLSSSCTLMKYDEEINQQRMHEYRRKMNSICYLMTMTKSNIISKVCMHRSTINFRDFCKTCVVHSLAVGLGFGQKFKPDPRVDVRPGWTDQSSQPDPRVGVRRVLPSLFETSYI